MKVLRAIGRWWWGILAALGALALAIVGLGRWWRRRRLVGYLRTTVEGMARERVREAEEAADATMRQAGTDAVEAVLESQNQATEELENDRRSLSDRLRDAGAGRPGPVAGDPAADE